MLPLARLWQPVTRGPQQLCRAAEEAAVGENLLQRLVGFVHTAVFQLPSAQIALLHFVLGQQHLSTETRLFQQQQCCASTQISLFEPLPPLCGFQIQPLFDSFLFDRHLLSQHFEHRLVAITEGVEAITQAQCFARIIQHTGIGQTTTLEHFEHAVGHDVVQTNQLRVVSAATQQFQSFYRTVVGQEEVVAVVAPVHFGGVLHHIFDLAARQVQWY
ncbi:hypothetical protein D3C81_1136290 [compost metagenome]